MSENDNVIDLAKYRKPPMVRAPLPYVDIKELEDVILRDINDPTVEVSSTTADAVFAQELSAVFARFRQSPTE